jgi:hypothetical protein
MKPSNFAKIMLKIDLLHCTDPKVYLSSLCYNHEDSLVVFTTLASYSKSVV